MDGIDPPENMIRCVLNNYSTRGFWRSWHRSYNLWLIRYLYVPIVTATNTVVATLLVFTFVALWHDLSLHLLAWGWLITLFVIPEMIAVKAVPETKVCSSDLSFGKLERMVVLSFVLLLLHSTATSHGTGTSVRLEPSATSS